MMSQSSLQGHSSIEAMALNWCSLLKSSRPPDRSRCSPASGATRVLASNKDFALPRPASMQLPPQPSWVSCPCSYKSGRNFKELSSLVVSYSWVFQDRSSQAMACPVKKLNFVATYSGRRRNSFSRCKKRTCEALTIICLLVLESFLPGYGYSYSQAALDLKLELKFHTPVKTPAMCRLMLV